ncbi:MAG TPA: hypothetical protein VME18_13315 [Acidobacteriaceae bacterium]|nr:hypothetical protein [Acidobacteriaceae bacterium]
MPTHRDELRLWLNLYLPSVKLVKKVRVGSKLRRVYDQARTPFERVLASGQADSRRVRQLTELRASLDPFALGKSIDRKLERIYGMANRRLSPKATPVQPGTPRGAAKNGQPQGRENDTRCANLESAAHFPYFHGPGDGLHP